MVDVESVESPEVGQIKGNVRVEDKMRLRELELQTQYELKYLANDLRDLRRCVESQNGHEAAKFEALNKRVSLITYLVLAQMAGIDIEALMSIFQKLPL